MANLLQGEHRQPVTIGDRETRKEVTTMAKKSKGDSTFKFMIPDQADLLDEFVDQIEGDAKPRTPTASRL